MIRVLLVAGGTVFALLGVLHAAYTWADIRTPRRLVPDNPAVMDAMAKSAVRLSQGETTMWRAWIGFNFSHSLGALLFGLCCIALGVTLDSILPPKSVLVVPVAIACAYQWLAIRYWFRIPSLAIAAGTSCLALAWIAY